MDPYLIPLMTIKQIRFKTYKNIGIVVPMTNIILDRSYFSCWIETTKIIYLFAKFSACLIRPTYSPKIGIVGLWAFEASALLVLVICPN